MAAYEHGPRPDTIVTVRGLKVLYALRLMITECVPAIFRIGCLVTNCHWNGRDPTTAYHAKGVLHHCMVLLLRMSDGHEHQVDYNRTINFALLHWTEWYDASAAELHCEEICEAPLSRLASGVRLHPNMHFAADVSEFVCWSTKYQACWSVSGGNTLETQAVDQASTEEVDG